jgi:hypothetical protein
MHISPPTIRAPRLAALAGDFLWAVILVPILAISWVGFYTIARDIGAPVIFAAGLSAAFDGIALFAARTGLRHRRKGFSGYLARITVILFAALGSFVQSFHGQSQAWIHAHSWIVWAIAPIAACLAYELHLGWVHRKQLIKNGYVHPSAKSGFGPATWIQFPWGTLHDYRDVLRARRRFIAASNLKRFKLEEAAQSKSSPGTVSSPAPPATASTPNPARRPVSRPVSSPAKAPTLHSVPDAVPSSPPKSSKSNKLKPQRAASASVRGGSSPNAEVRAWCIENGFELGFNNRVPIEGLRAYRAARKQAS